MTTCPCCGEEWLNEVLESDVDTLTSFAIAKLKPDEGLSIGLHRKHFRKRLAQGETVEQIKLDYMGSKPLAHT